jgi:hypothetical protein
MTPAALIFGHLRRRRGRRRRDLVPFGPGKTGALVSGVLFSPRLNLPAFSSNCEQANSFDA